MLASVQNSIRNPLVPGLCLLGRLLCLVPLAVTGCSNGDEEVDYLALAASCSIDDQYFFYARSPKNISHTPDLESVFNSLLYSGGDIRFPSTMTNVRSSLSSNDAFNRYNGAGQALGYRAVVNSLETHDESELDLYVRFVDPGSPAAALGTSADPLVGMTPLHADTSACLLTTTAAALTSKQRSLSVQLNQREGMLR